MGRYLSAGVLLLMASVHFTCADNHSHYFHMTAISDPTSNVFSYSETRTLDDIVLMWYDSDDEVVERRVPWYKSANMNLYKESTLAYKQQMNVQKLLHWIRNYRNHTTGFQILQILEGCSIYDGGAVQASLLYHYDGKPFMFFNFKTVRFTAETPDDEAFVQIFNSNSSVLQQLLHVLVNTCIPHITELLDLGKCTFSRKEAPVVKVTPILVDNGTLRVRCRAYGHYPKDISIMWYQNGHQISEEMMERTTLPLLDLTYLTSLSLNVTSMVDDVYTCKVNHSSMPRGVTQDWRVPSNSGNLSSAPPSPPIWAVITICLAIILVIAVIMFVSVSFALKRRQLHEPFE